MDTVRFFCFDSAFIVTTGSSYRYFALTDRIAMGLLQAAFQVGISVPGQVSIIGYDNLDFSQFLTPPLTTINQAGFEMGYVAARLLLNMIEKEIDSTVIEDVVMKPELILRQSTAISHNKT